MIHNIDSDSVYYDKYDSIYYFKNELSKYDNRILRVIPPLKPDKKTLLLKDNSFLVLKKKQGYIAIQDEDDSNRCLYFGEFFEDDCLSISVDYDNTTCKVIVFYAQKDNKVISSKFALLLNYKSLAVFDVVKKSGDSYKCVYAFDQQAKKVINKTMGYNFWEKTVKDIRLTDYEDSFSDIRVDFDFLKKIKDSGFRFTKYFNK